jgi:hypothetical protein
MRPALLFSFLIFTFSFVRAADVPALPEKVEAGIERGVWTVEGWGNSGSAEKVVSGDQKFLKLIYAADDKDKAAYKHLTCFGLAFKGKVRMWIYAAKDDPPAVGIALSTTLAYIWHESKPVDLKKGWNKIEISAANNDWKTAVSEWKFSTAIEPRDDVRAVDIVVYNGKSEGQLLVYGLTYDPDEKGEKVKALAKELQSEDGDKREAAEKALVEIGRPALEVLNQLAEDERPEVLLRAASARRQIEAIKEPPPPDPKIRAELEKQRTEQSYEEARRRTDYAVARLDNERAKILGLLKDAQTELTQGKADLEKMGNVDPEKRKVYEGLLAKLDAALQELAPYAKPKPAK